MGRLGLPALVVGLVCLPLSALVSADEFRAEARVDRNVLGVGERLTLTIEVTGVSRISGPDMDNIEGFRIINTSTSQTISIVNFDAVRLLNLQFVLEAVAEGEYILGPFSIQSGKEIVETDPLKVTVIQGQGPPPAAAPTADDDDAVKVRASVDKTRAYVGEQITYNLQFAYTARPRDLTYTPPDHAGFWTEEVGETGPSIETIDGRRYYVVNKRTAFFPISGGKFTIGEASVRYVAGMSSFFFDPFGSARSREGRAATQSVDVVVRQLPSEGRPAGFGGAVGTFSLQVAPSTREVKAGESLTLSVRISGRGNIKSIGDITVPELEGFRVFAPKARETTDVDGLQVGGEKVFDLVLVPERPGDQVIPEFEFSYFDPRKEAYVTLHSDPISLKVLSGDDMFLSGAAGTSPQVQAARRDIRHIKRVEISQNSLVASGRSVPGFLMAYVPALVGIVGLIVSVRRRRAAISGKGALRRAHRSAMLDLKHARGMAAGDDRLGESAGLAAKAVRTYMAGIAGTSEALVDRNTMSSMAGIGEATKAGIADLLDALDRIRFAPVGANPAEVADLVNRAESLVKAAHAEWSK